MHQSLLISALKPVVELFNRLGIRWYVVGSVASSILGVARTTLDADIVADLKLDHVKPIVDALRTEYYVSEPMITNAIEREKSFNVIHLATSFKIDVFSLKKRAFDQSTVQRIRPDTFTEFEEHLSLMIAAPEDVVVSKLDWYRKGDEISERQWNDILGVIRIQKSTLDLIYLRHWANELKVADLLERALTELGVPNA